MHNECVGSAVIRKWYAIQHQQKKMIQNQKKRSHIHCADSKSARLPFLAQLARLPYAQMRCVNDCVYAPHRRYNQMGRSFVCVMYIHYACVCVCVGWCLCAPVNS